MRSHFSLGVASSTELIIRPTEISASCAVLMEKLGEMYTNTKLEKRGTFKTAVEYWHADIGYLAFLCVIMDVIRQENIHIKKI